MAMFEQSPTAARQKLGKLPSQHSIDKTKRSHRRSEHIVHCSFLLLTWTTTDCIWGPKQTPPHTVAKTGGAHVVPSRDAIRPVAMLSTPKPRRREMRKVLHA